MGEKIMSVFVDCQESRDGVEYRLSRAGRGRGAIYWTCLVVLAGLCRSTSSAAADGGVPPAAEPSPFGRLMNLLSGTSDQPAVPPRGTSKLPTIGTSGGLVREQEKPGDYQQIVADSLYPPTAAPEKLTAERLDAIAKLAPKPNKAGMRVHPAMIPLFRSMVLNYTGGSYRNAPIRFRLHVPEPYRKGKMYPLVVWLHGAGECGSDNVNQLSHLHHIIPYLVGPKKRDFFLLVPQCPHAHVSWEAPEICATTVRGDGSVECHVVDDPVALCDAPLAYTIVMIEAVMKEFPIDRNRVTVAGLSTGGDGVWRMLERRPELFAAAVPVVSWEAMQESSLREKPLLKKIPIWAIYSSDDRAIDYARKEFERMRERGCHVSKTEFGVCGHRAWTPAMLQGDIFGWLISRAKNGDRFFAAEPSPTSPEKIGVFADVTEGDLARKPTKAVAGAPPTGQPDLRPSPTAPLQVVPQPPATAPAAVPGMPNRYSAPYIPGYAPPSTMPRPRVLPYGAQPAYLSVDDLRVELMVRYATIGETNKAIAVADKVKNRQALVAGLLRGPATRELLDYADRELDRMEQRGETPAPPNYYPLPATRAQPPASSYIPRSENGAIPQVTPRPLPKEEALKPIPAGKETPLEKCGKEWSMSTTTLYGLFPNGWDQEANHVPGYIVNESGRQLRDRLAKAFASNDLAATKEFCESFIRLDDIPLSSPWFDTSGGRLQGRIKYALNEKAKPVVELLRDIARVQAESKKNLVELARKSLERIDAITRPKTEK
jgi:pimeloyl-ACP methyl ester carboxylesterase